MSRDLNQDCVKDLQCMERFGCNYTKYVHQAIDQLCQMQDTTGLARNIVLSEVSPHNCCYIAPKEAIAAVKSQMSCIQL